MTFIVGTRLGPYEITRALGSGGMGEVYLARDTRLGRDVAIKVLAKHISSDSELKQRLEREAKALSSLNHPNICTLHDIGSQDGIDYLVLEYVEGQTLAEQLRKGPLSTERVLKIGIEITEALDNAHRQGIIHRDLKPANIMLTKSGVKLLDFGLAKLRAPDSRANLEELTTAERSLTADRSVLGTLGYMAPEQLERKELDSRTDLFALGAVLYEMATGRKAFEGKAPASVLAAVLERDPKPISAIRPLSPPALDWVVKDCLAKNPECRCDTAHDVMLQLRWIAETGLQGRIQPVTDARKARWRLWSIGLISAVALIALATISFRLYRTAPPATVRFLVFPPVKTSFWDRVAVSPDGRRLAFVGSTADGKNTMLWIRPLGSLEAEQLPGTENASDLFWSPDSRYIGFFADRKLKKVELSAGTAQTLCDAATKVYPYGGTWNQNGVILFVADESRGVLRISAAGGLPTRVTIPEESRQEISHTWPYFLPDGQHFLYFVQSREKNRQGVYAGSLHSKDTHLLVNADSNAAYASPGYLLFIRDGRLFTQPFDAARLAMRGEALPIAEQVQFFDPAHRGNFSVSMTGVLAYQAAPPATSHLVWVDRAGKETATAGPPADYLDLELSPDGKRVAVERLDLPTNTAHIWVLELSRGILSQLTFTRSWEYCPRWSPDGSRIMYDSNRKYALGGSPGEIHATATNGGGRDDLLVETTSWIWPYDWSPDGRFILYGTHGDSIESWVKPLVGERTASLYLQGAVDGRFSPDGRWIAYNSNDSGTWEVYVRPFPPAKGKWQVSVQGGSQVLWRGDGKELFYLAPGGKLMAAPVPTGSRFEVGNPAVLFETHDLVPNYGSRYLFAASHDGKHFLMNKLVTEPTPAPIAIVLNWDAELR